jgi:WD40 repeat protein
MDTLECTHVLHGHADRVSFVTFTLDGHIVSGSWDKTVRTWRMDTGESIETLSVEKEVFSVAVSPDDSLIAIGAAKLLVLYDRRTHSKLRNLDQVASSVFSVAFSPSGDQLVAGMKDGSVRLWDLSFGEPRAHAGEQSSFRHSKEVTSVAWSFDGTKVFSALRDATVHANDVLESELLKGQINARGFRSPLQDLRLLPHASHSRLVAVDEDGGMTLWDEGVLDVSSASSDAFDIAALAFSPDGALLATSSSTGTVIIRNAANGVTMGTLRGSAAAVQDLVFSQDGAELSLLHEDSSASTWKAGVDFSVPLITSSLDTVAGDDLEFTTDHDSWLYAHQPGIPTRLRLCWIPPDRRWSNWSTQVAWSGTKIAFGNDDGVLTMIDLSDV